MDTWTCRIISVDDVLVMLKKPVDEYLVQKILLFKIYKHKILMYCINNTKSGLRALSG